MRNRLDITDRSPGRCRDNTDRARIRRNRLFVLLCKHTHLRKLALELFEPHIPLTHAIERDLLCIELIFAVPLIHLHRTAHDYIVALFHAEGESAPVARKHHTCDRSHRILERKINMPRCVVLTVRHLAPHQNPLQQKILCKHIFDILIYLSDGIYVLFHNIPCCPSGLRHLCDTCQHAVDKRRGVVLPILLCQLDRLIDRHSGRYIFLIFDLIDCHTDQGELHLRHTACLPVCRT